MEAERGGRFLHLGQEVAEKAAERGWELDDLMEEEVGLEGQMELAQSRSK